MSNVEDNLREIQDPINTAPPEVKQIVEKVLDLEKSRLYAKNLKNINDDILKIIKEVIQ